MSQIASAPDRRRWLALALLGTAFFMVILDGTIVYVALPAIADDLGFSAGGVQWVMSAYLLCSGALLLLGGRTADLLGRRRVFMVGVGLFVSSSLLCGLAWSPTVLIAARVVQGVSAAIMAPTALSLLMTVFPEGPDRNKALGIWGGIGGIGATAGLLIGGPVTSSLGWEWVFFINIPVGLAVLLLTPRLLRESVDAACARCFDLAGAITVTTALLLLVYAIAEAPAASWASVQTIGLLLTSAALLALFGLIEARSPGPLVPLRIFRSRALVGGNLVLLTAGMAIDGTLLIVTVYAQEVLGYSAVQFGLMTAALTVMSVIGAYTAQAVVTRTGFRRVGVAGMALVGAACLLLTQVSVDGSYLEDIFLGLLVFGTGLGAAFVAAQIAALAGVAEEESGLAAGLVDSSFTIGGALGIAILTTVAVSRAGDALSGVGREAELRALTEGFQTAFAVAVGLAALGALLAVLLFRPRRLVENPTFGAESRLESSGFEQAHDYAAGERPERREWFEKAVQRQEHRRRERRDMTTERFLNTYHNASTAPSPDVPADLASFMLAADPVLAEAAELARILARAHQGAATQLIGEGWAHARKYFSLSEKYAAWADYRAPAKGSGIHAYAHEVSRPIRLTDEELRAHPEWRNFGEEIDRHQPLRGWLAVPLIGSDGANYGFIQASDRLEGEFTEQDEANLVRLAALTSTALDALAQLHLPDYRRKVRAVVGVEGGRADP